MDWTSVYIESGEEDLLIPLLLKEHPTAPRVSLFVSRLYHAHHHDGDGDDPATQIMSHHRLFELLEHHHSSSSSSAYTLRALYYLCINFILGVGCLGVPYAFRRAGFVLCASVLLTVTILSYMTVMWVAESGARLLILERRTLMNSSYSKQQQQQSHDYQHGHDDDAILRPQTTGVATTTNRTAPSECTTLLTTTTTPDATTRPTREQRDVAVDVDDYEVIDLVSYFLGPIHKVIYQVSLMALMYIGLLAYTQVFCGSIATLLWGPPSLDNGQQQADDDDDDNVGTILGLPQLVFAIMVVPLSCCDLEEQVAIQSFMASVRFLALFVMIGGSTMALMLDNPLSHREHAPYFAPAEPQDCQMSYIACFSGFGVAFSTALFSQLFQHSVPGLLRPLCDEPAKIKQAPKVFGASLFTTFSFYLLLGTSAASYFGANTLSSVNLNFAGFTFGLDVSSSSQLTRTMLKAASSVVVMFPALDTISVFPLIANTLGNNLLRASGPKFVKWIAHHLPSRTTTTTTQLSSASASYWTRPFAQLRIRRRRRSSSFHDLPLDIRKSLVQRASKIATIVWRLVAALPPLVGSLWATDLSFSLLLAGVAGIYVAFFAPSLLQLSSCRQVMTEEQPTIFSGWYSRPLLAYPVIVFATFSLGVVLLQIRDALISGRT